MKLAKVVYLTAIILSANYAYSDDSSKLEAERLLEVMEMDSILQQSIVAMLDAQIKQNPEMGVYKDVMVKFFNKYMSYQSLKPEMIELYSSEFSAKELIEIREFYSTNTGKKALIKAPMLMGKGAEIGSQKVQQNINELQQMIKDESERIQKMQQQNK